MGRQYDKDYMKMAMLKQEETFRQQVHELHRLYRVQKILMDDMKAEFKRQRKFLKIQSRPDGWNSETDAYYIHQNQRSRARQLLDLELPAEQYIEKDAMQEAEDDSELELTLATGSSSRRRKKENSISDSGASFSSSSTESGGVKLNGNDWRLLQVPDITFNSYRNEIMNSKFNAEDQMSGERMKQHPWLLQCLSLKMT